MKAQFSEFQFTYGLTREIENNSSKYDVPFLPSQVLENRLPVDVMHPPTSRRYAPLLLQYKRSDGLTRSNAGEWHDFNQEYYRFDIYPQEKSDQHNRLVELSSAIDDVYYAAPGFYQNTTYRGHARRGNLAQNTAFVDISTCPEVRDGDSHSIAYTLTPPEGRFYSEPKAISVVSGFDDLRSRIAEQDSFVEIDTLFSTIREAEEILGIKQDRTEPDELLDWMYEKQNSFARNVGAGLYFISE